MMVGKLIGERYQAVLALGTSELARTYLAQDTHRPGRPLCVVKHLLESASDDCHLLQAGRQRLIREAGVLKQLGNHNQIPQLLAFHKESYELYLVQEFIAGPPLSMQLPSGSYWSEDQVIQLLQEVLGVLEFAHNHGVSHQNIKPDNIIRRKQDNQLVLINFGLAEQFSELVATGQQNYAGIANATARPHLDNDIYALGVIGIQALTGLSETQPPEDSDIGEVLRQSQAQVSPELTCVLDKMVHRCFEDPCQPTVEALQALQPLANQYLPMGQETPWEPSLMELEVPPQLSVTTGQIPQALPAEENTSSVFATDLSGSLVDSQMDQASIPTLDHKSPLLIGIGIGSITVALAVGFFYVLWLFTATPELQRKSVSIPLQVGKSGMALLNRE